MNKSKKIILKQIKQHLKSEKLFKEYKTTFKNKQMHFLISKISFIFELDLDYQQLINCEKKLISQNNMEMYLKPLEEMFLLSKNLKTKKISTQNLAYFLYYIYQTSRYYDDKKNDIQNVFIGNDGENLSIIQNNSKRNYYYNFVSELKRLFPDYNLYVIELLKLVM